MFYIKQEVAAARIIDKLNGLKAQPYNGYLDAEDLNTVRFGVKDLKILTQVTNNDRGLAKQIAKAGVISDGNSSNDGKSQCSSYFAIRLVLFPASHSRPASLHYDSGEFGFRSYS